MRGSSILRAHLARDSPQPSLRTRPTPVQMEQEELEHKLPQNLPNWPESPTGAAPRGTFADLILGRHRTGTGGRGACQAETPCASGACGNWEK